MTPTFEVLGTEPGTLTLDDGFQAFVAGYTGRDRAAVQHHIDELAAIGVAPPPEVPMFYPMDAELVSTAEAFDDRPTLTSGEVEPLYIRHRGRWYFGVASDHTDRDLETEDILRSKLACPKPVGGQVVPIDDLGTFELDALDARSSVDGADYQAGSLAGLRQPADVIGRLLERHDLGDGDLVVLGGTLPLLDGTFTAGAEWRLEIDLPDGTRLAHTYTMNRKEAH